MRFISKNLFVLCAFMVTGSVSLYAGHPISTRASNLLQQCQIEMSGLDPGAHITVSFTDELLSVKSGADIVVAYCLAFADPADERVVEYLRGESESLGKIPGVMTRRMSRDISNFALFYHGIHHLSGAAHIDALVERMYAEIEPWERIMVAMKLSRHPQERRIGEALLHSLMQVSEQYMPHMKVIILKIMPSDLLGMPRLSWDISCSSMMTWTFSNGHIESCCPWLLGSPILLWIPIQPLF